MASLSNVCMNGSCGSTSSIQWRKGWGLRSGGSAILCDNCGSVYGQLVFCDTFHLKETGWRACSSCGKRLHCGCIASKSFLELLDDGSVECINCVKRAELSSIQIPRDEEPNGCSMSAKEHIDEMQSISFCTKTDVVDKKKLMLLGTSMEGEGQNSPLQSQKDETNGSTAQTNREQVVSPVREVRGSRVSSLTQIPIGSFVIGKQEDGKQTRGIKRMYESLAQTSLSKTICAPSGSLNLALHTLGVPAEAKEHQLASSFQQGQKSRHLLPKPIKIGHDTGPEGSKDVFPQLRVARPPVEGRGRNQLLPRYWPRITDQELQQISGDSNSTIVPLFEKVLSASDAGRIGRLVLPKACAEAFFPPISQPEGLPLRIQDVKGKEWMFQFRFWPNNNSRMYVLEGVTPCIQSMQLQAGDTVTFSRMDPEGKLVMGCRKALNQQNTQETQISATLNGTPTNGTFVSGTIENLPVVSGYSSHLQSMKGTSPHLNALPEPLNSTNGGISWRRAEDHGGWPSEGLSMQSLLVSENKRSRNIGSKSRRLIMDSEDVLTLRLTWEEAQDLLRPPPTVKPTIVMIEGYEFEEYEEPPVFGKKTIFTAQPFGGQDQWAQCDSCSRWRKLPAEVLLPPMWTCADNAWDPERCSCSAPDEMSSKDLENFLRMNMDIKQRRVTTSNKLTQERETSALDALATVAVLGDNRGDSGTPSVATTTRHPRHRPGCTCIVCIQPPSGQGPKHIPTCTCNVCMTVKRRFETLMMRKKKRKELELEIAQRNPPILFPKDEVEQDGASRHTALLPPDHSEFEARPPSNEPESCTLNKITTDTSKGQIDLNCDPDRDDDLQAGLTPATMTSLLQVASRPLETYLQRNGLASLASENQPSSSSNVLQQVTENCEGQPPDEAPTDVAQVRENGSYDEENSVHDETEEDTV